MHGQGRGRLATGTLAEFDHGYAGTIAELGYPTRSALRAWRDGREGTGEVPAGRFATSPRHAAETGRRAAGRRPGHGRDDGGPRLPQEPRAGRRARAGTARAPRSEAQEGGDSPEGRVRVVAGPGRGTGPPRGWPSDTARRGRHPTPGMGR